jgi:hypothetical protein
MIVCRGREVKHLAQELAHFISVLYLTHLEKPRDLQGNGVVLGSSGLKACNI